MCLKSDDKNDKVTVASTANIGSVLKVDREASPVTSLTFSCCGRRAVRDGRTSEVGLALSQLRGTLSLCPGLRRLRPALIHPAGPQRGEAPYLPPRGPPERRDTVHTYPADPRRGEAPYVPRRPPERHHIPRRGTLLSPVKRHHIPRRGTLLSPVKRHHIPRRGTLLSPVKRHHILPPRGEAPCILHTLPARRRGTVSVARRRTGPDMGTWAAGAELPSRGSAPGRRRRRRGGEPRRPSAGQWAPAGRGRLSR